MKLLVLTADWAPIEGGIASLTEGLVRALGRRGHQLTVLAPARPGAAATTVEAGVSIERWPGYRLGFARGLGLFAASWPKIRSHDAILAMNPAHGGVIAALGRTLGGPPYLAWAYGFELLKSRGTPLAPLYRRVFGRARAAVAISHFTAGLLARLGVAPGQVRIVPPGVDPAPPWHGEDPASLAARLSLPPGRVVLTVGRLVPRKGHLTLLRALGPVLQSHPDLLWVVAGRGPLEGRITAEAAALGLASRVHLLGYVAPAKLEDLYRLASVFALVPAASEADAEGFGLVFLEAGARAVPVVAGRSGGVPEAVSHGENGLLANPHDPGDIARALGAILDDPALASRLGAGGLARSARHSWDGVAESVEAILDGRETR